MTQDTSIRLKQLKQENHVGPEEHVKRLDVGPVDRSMYQQKASGRGLGHQAKKIGYCAKDIGVAESTGRLGNRLQERTMRRKIRRSVEGPMTCRTTWLITSIEILF